MPTIVALKDAGGDPAATAALIAEAPDGFEVYSGDEPLTLAFLAYGAVGVVGVSSHWTAPVQAEMFAAFEAGDVAAARALNAAPAAQSTRFMNSDTCVFSQAVKVADGRARRARRRVPPAARPGPRGHRRRAAASRRRSCRASGYRTTLMTAAPSRHLPRRAR